MSRPIRVLICEDHKVLADSLAFLITHSEDVELVGDPVANVEDAVAVTLATKPDIVLMDVNLGDSIDGIEGTRRVKDVSPTTRVVVMTGMAPQEVLVRAVESGAAALLSKTSAAEDLIDALRAVAEGESLIDGAQLAQLLQDLSSERTHRRHADLLLSQLTPRELEILELLARGRRNNEIAESLFISPQTVQTHVRNILAKLGVHSKLEAVSFAVRNGAIQI